MYCTYIIVLACMWLTVPVAIARNTISMDDVMMMVRRLQSHVAAADKTRSQDRSLLVYIQEKLEKQEKDIEYLKTEITLLIHQQDLNTDVIQKVKSTKEVQTDKDGHVQKLVHGPMNNAKIIERYPINSINVSVLKSEMNSLKREVESNRDDLQLLKSKLAENKATDGPQGDMIPGILQDNSIQLLGHKHGSIPIEGSGDVDVGPTTPSIDRVLSMMEEKDNKISGQIRQLNSAKTSLMNKFNTIEKKLNIKDVRRDKEISNLSKKVATVENNVLRQLKDKSAGEMEQMKVTIQNFTKKMFGLQDWHRAKALTIDLTHHHGKQISNLHKIVNFTQQGLAALERTILKERAISQRSAQTLQTFINKMNTSFNELSRKLRSHRYVASTEFKGVDTDVAELKQTTKKLSDRLAYAEIKYLTYDVSVCTKTNNDLVQNLKLTDLEKSIRYTNEKAIANDNRIIRLDKSLFRLSKDYQHKAKMISKLTVQTGNIMKKLPSIVTIQNELGKLMHHVPKDCSDQKHHSIPSSGTYLIKPPYAKGTVKAFCEVEKQNTWTYIQHRFHGNVLFTRSWNDYKKGFGDSGGEYWIGNENIHLITSARNYTLRIEMWDMYDVYWYADYEHFSISGEKDKYKMHISGYSGNATDSLGYSNGIAFSSQDKDNDASSTHCAKFYMSGWWYKHCHYSNLNGRFDIGIVWFNHNMDEWVQMKKTVMKIRPSNPLPSNRNKV